MKFIKSLGRYIKNSEYVIMIIFFVLGLIITPVGALCIDCSTLVVFPALMFGLGITFLVLSAFFLVCLLAYEL